MKTSSLIFLLVALSLSLSCSVAEAARTIADKSLRVIDSVDPVFPREQLQRTNKGECRIAISVGADGKLQDTLIVGYTKRAFAEAAIDALKLWTFEPAQYQGAPVAVVSEIEFSFEATGVIISMSPMDNIDALLSRWDRQQYEYRVRELKELDRIPPPVKVVKPVYPKELAAAGARGDVIIGFFIDETGRIRMPAVKRADDMRLADLATEGLSQWKFEPPTMQERPVLVHVVQVFRFQAP
jgi:TonB family protein